MPKRSYPRYGRQPAVKAKSVQSYPVTCSIPGRLCLAGEDLDWLGGGAITCTISELQSVVKAVPLPSARIVLHESSDSQIEIRSASGVFNEELTVNSKGGAGKYVYHVLQRLPVAVLERGWEVTIGGNLPVGAGLSSSAALCVGLVASLSRSSGIALDPLQVARFAYQAEQPFTGCGPLDHYSITCGGALYINFLQGNIKIQRLALPKNVCFVVADSGRRHETKEVISWLRSRYESGEREIIRYVREARKAVAALLHILAEGDANPIEIGIIINKCQVLLREGEKISTPELEHLISISLEEGALGAKITGSGFGGCILALALREDAPKIATALSLQATQVTVCGLFNKGVSYY